LRRLFTINLKVGEFEAAHQGQMSLYLRYVEKHEHEHEHEYEQMEGEATPIGLILCVGKNKDYLVYEDLLK